MNDQPIVSDLVAIVQTSLAPVFLLAGTAGFLSIYTVRLGRVSDRLNEIADSGRALREQDPELRRRALTLVVAMILGAVAAICTGSAILNLLAGALAIGWREENLLWLFGGAIVSLIASLIAFLFELLLCGRTMLRQSKMGQTPEGHE